MLGLVSATDLAAILDDPELRIADVRWSLADPAAGAAYAEAHLPGAVFVDLDTVLTAPAGPGAIPSRTRTPSSPPSAPWASTASTASWPTTTPAGRSRPACGGCSTSSVTPGSPSSMRDRCVAQHRPAADGRLPAYPAGTAWPAPPRDLAADHSPARSSRRASEHSSPLDARAPERYRGEVEPIDPIAGHIPKAVSAPTSTFLAADGRFLDRHALQERFAELGAGPGRPVAVACGSGVNACQLALARRARRPPRPPPLPRLLLGPGVARGCPSRPDRSRARYPAADPGLPGTTGPTGRPRRAGSERR